jgi:Glycosyltransferase family 10 (fucosyltransferase) C-term/Fucosyltransferase, N-terminal
LSLWVRAQKAKGLGELALFRWLYDWERTAPSGDRPLILFFNDMWGRAPALPFSGIPEDCEITTNRRRMREADAVVFHIPSLGALTRVRKFPGQLWVALSLECEAHYPRLRDPGFMDRFDLTMTYQRNADVAWPYYRPDLERSLRTPPRPKSGDKLSALFMSGRHDLSGRNAYASELMHHLDVHSYGRRLRNRRLRPDHGRQSKMDTIAGYKFTLAFENAIAPDYVTEKFFDPLIAGSVPVYLGAPNIEEFAPADRCYIDVADFDGPRAVADHLLSLAEDDAAYRRYLAWKQQPLRQGFLELLAEQRIDPLVRLCQKVREQQAVRLPD